MVLACGILSFFILLYYQNHADIKLEIESWVPSNSREFCSLFSCICVWIYVASVGDARMKPYNEPLAFH